MANILFKIVRICNSQFKWNYLKNEQLFLSFFLNFWILHQILNILKRKILVIANVFPKLHTMKRLVRTVFKQQRFKTGSGSQCVKVSQTLPKSPWEPFYYVFSSWSEKLIWKLSPLVVGEILRVFVNRLTAIDKNPANDCQNLPLPIQSQLSEKQKTFLIFCSISRIYIKFSTFWKKRWSS